MMAKTAKNPPLVTGKGAVKAGKASVANEKAKANKTATPSRSRTKPKPPLKAMKVC